MNSILGLMLVALVVSGCSNRLRNRMDPNVVECGLTEDQVVGKRVIRPDFLIENELVQLFDSSGNVVGSFEVTEKNCLLLEDESPAVAMVYGNRVASWLDRGKVEFKSCGQDCGVFPVCGYFKNAPASGGAWVYAQIPEVGSKQVNAILEGDSGPQTVAISDQSCLKLNAGQKGFLRVTDSDGNFFENDIQEFVTASPRKGDLLTMALRPPLTPDEAQCRKNPDSYKLIGDKCVPKDLRDFCSDLQLIRRKKELESYFGTSDCDRIWSGFAHSTYLGVGRMNLNSTKYFSGLPKLKGLNVSANPYLGSFSEMKGTENIEELIVQYANFDLRDLTFFPKLRHLDISDFKQNWQDAPSFPQVKALTISLYQSDPNVLEKFPEVEEIFLILSESSTSLKVLGKLKKLRKIVIYGGFDNSLKYTEIPDLDLLEDIRAPSLAGFSGKYPRLKKVEVDDDVNVRILVPSRDLEFVRISAKEPHPDNWKEVAFFGLKKAVISGSVASFAQHAFPDLEDLEILDEFPEEDGRILAPFKNLRSLKITTFEIVRFDDMEFPELLFLEASCSCQYNSLSLPKLETLKAYQDYKSNFDMTGLKMPSLRFLTLEQASTKREYELKLPDLPNLQSLKMNVNLENLDFLSQITPKMTSLKISLKDRFDMSSIPTHIEYLDLWDSEYVDLNSFGNFRHLKNLRVQLNEKTTGSLGKDLILDSLAVNVSGPVVWQDASRFIVKDSLVLRGDYEFLVQNNYLDTSQLSKLNVSTPDSLNAILDTKGKHPLVKSIEIENWVGFDQKHPLMDAFPGLQNLRISIANWSTFYDPSATIDRLIPVDTTVSEFEMYNYSFVSDRERSFLGCEKYQYENSIYGSICFPIDADHGRHYQYRPSGMDLGYF